MGIKVNINFTESVKNVEKEKKRRRRMANSLQSQSFCLPALSVCMCSGIDTPADDDDGQ